MHLLTWTQALPLLLVIVLAVYIPGGLIVAAAGRRRFIDLVALGPVVSIALAGVDGVLFYPLAISWGWTSYLTSAIVLIALILLVRTSLLHSLPFTPANETRQASEQASAENNETNLPSPSKYPVLSNVNRVASCLLGFVLAAFTTAIRLIHAVPSPEQVTQNYDSVFHENVVARIIMTGQASSLHALPPVREVYPIAFQQFAALGAMAAKSAPTTTAVTCAWLVFAALIWPISMLFLVRSVVGAHPVTDVLALGLSSCCAGFPFLLLDWGTLYSMFAGQAILPVLLGLAWRWCRVQWRQGAQTAIAALPWILVACAAVSFSHFRVMMTGMLLVLPLVLIWLVQAGRQLHEYNRNIFRLVALAFLLAVCAVGTTAVGIFTHLYLRGNSRPISGHLNGGPAQPTDTITSAIGRYLLGQPIDSGNARMPTFWPIVVLLALMVIVALVEHKLESMILLSSFLLLGFVFVSCAGTHADWAKIVTALWYKDQRRVFAAWPIAAICLICWGMRAVLDKIALAKLSPAATVSLAASPSRGGNLSTSRVLQAGALMLTLIFCLLSCTFNPQLSAMQKAVGGVYSFALPGSKNSMLTKDKYLLLKRLSDHVGVDDTVVSDPWNGSGFMWAVSKRMPYYAHLNMLWDSDHAYLSSNFDKIQTDPKVCQILQKNNLQWFVDMGEPYANNDPQHAVFGGMHPTRGAMQPVDHQGSSVLYKITACGQ